MNSDRRRTVLLDTNIWLDYLIREREGHPFAMALIERTINAEGIDLCCFAGSLKDIYFIFQVDRKRALREGSGEVRDEDARAINEIAWAAITTIEDLATIIPSDMRTTWLAQRMKKLCSDFEDCLLLGACEIADVDFFVTNDKQLQRIAPVKAADAESILVYLQD